MLAFDAISGCSSTAPRPSSTEFRWPLSPRPSLHLPQVTSLEDVGLVCLASVASIRHARHSEFKRWIGDEWQATFDLDAVNKALRSKS